MARPRRARRIRFMPDVTYFKPQGIRIRDLEIIELTFDEIECVRLSEIKELSQVDAAKKMKIHQSTFQRSLARARKKIADALINGKAIKIQGGIYKIQRIRNSQDVKNKEVLNMSKGDKTGPEGKGPKTGRGLGYCSGNDKPGYMSDQPTQGMARGPRDGQGNGPRNGRGRGQGRGRGFNRSRD